MVAINVIEVVLEIIIEVERSIIIMFLLLVVVVVVVVVVVAVGVATMEMVVAAKVVIVALLLAEERKRTKRDLLPVGVEEGVVVMGEAKTVAPEEAQKKQRITAVLSLLLNRRLLVANHQHQRLLLLSVQKAETGGNAVADVVGMDGILRNRILPRLLTRLMSKFKRVRR